jgi:hypothetical protein
MDTGRISPGLAAGTATHLTSMMLSVRTPDELIAAIPHLLGFQPKESIVFLPIRSDLPVARVDLPTTARDRDVVWNSIRDTFSRYAQPGSSVGIVCLTADRQLADRIAEDFSARLDTIGIGTLVRVWADDRHWSDLDTRLTGILTAEARDRVAAMTVLGGRPQPAVSRESLATSLVGDREPIAKLLLEAREASDASTPRAEARWAVGRLHRFHDDGVRLSDIDAARLLVSIDSIPIRDNLWSDISRETVASHVALWTDMTRRAPDDVRAAPASMLGFAGWLSGHGALAWCALDQVPRDKPYSLAALVAASVQSGMHPREWEAIKSQTPTHGRDQSSDFFVKRQVAEQGPVRPAHGI